MAHRTYQLPGSRRQAIPKGESQGERVLARPAARDRVVQGVLTRILEPILEADGQEGSSGDRPGRSAPEAVERVADAIVQDKTRGLDLERSAPCDNMRHDVLLAKGAKRGSDPDVRPLRKLILQATGKPGVAQGDVLAPLRSNLYLPEVERMLERAKAGTRRGKDTYLEYARFADAIVLVSDASPQHDGLLGAVMQRLREALAVLHVTRNEAQSWSVDLAKGESVGLLGGDVRRGRTRRGTWRAHDAPRLKQRTARRRKLQAIFRRVQSQAVDRVIELIHPILRGWVTYYAIGEASRGFGPVRDWVEKKMRRHVMRARKRKGCGWKRWRRRWLSDSLGFMGVLPCPSAQAAAAESPPRLRGPLTLGMKRAGVRRVGNPHAAYDVAGVGNSVTGRTEAPARGESRRQTATPRTYDHRAYSRPYLYGGRRVTGVPTVATAPDGDLTWADQYGSKTSSFHS